MDSQPKLTTTTDPEMVTKSKVLESASTDISSFDKLHSVLHHIFHYLKTDHPHVILPLNKTLYKEFLPKVYKTVTLKGDELHRMLFETVQEELKERSCTNEDVLNKHKTEAFKFIEKMVILDLEKITRIGLTWSALWHNTLFPNLKAIHLEDRALLACLPLFPNCIAKKRPFEAKFIQALLKSSSAKGITLHFPILERSDRVKNYEEDQKDKEGEEDTEDDENEEDEKNKEDIQRYYYRFIHHTTGFIYSISDAVNKDVRPTFTVKIPFEKVNEYATNVLSNHSRKRPSVILEIYNIEDTPLVAVIKSLWLNMIETRDYTRDREISNGTSDMGNDDLRFILPNQEGLEDALAELNKKLVSKWNRKLWKRFENSIGCRNSDDLD